MHFKSTLVMLMHLVLVPTLKINTTTNMKNSSSDGEEN